MPERGAAPVRGTASTAIEPDLKRAEKILLEMVAIPGGSCREEPIARYITGHLVRAGVARSAIVRDQAHRRSPHGGQCGNLICRLPGTIPGGCRMLCAHMDTVPLGVGARPVLRKGFVVPADKATALGADDRAGATAILVAALEVVRRRLPHPPLVFLWTVQEELGLYGARFASVGMLGRPRLAFNFDGGSPEQVTIGATGGYRMQIRVRGIASHAGVAPEKGVSAIAIASLAVAELHRKGWHGLVAREGGCGTSNVGVIRGGDATNVVTPEVEVHAEARSHDAAFRGRIVRAIQQAFHRAARSVRSVDGACGSVKIHGRLDYESFRLPDNDPSLAVAEAAVRSVGGNPVRAVSNGGLDANWLTARGIPCVSLGSGVANAHTPDERLDLGEFHQACRIALRVAAPLP
jgi:tripeptide aminopeptidase